MSSQLEVIFMINDNELNEGNLGVLSVKDLETDRIYEFGVRGNSEQNVPAELLESLHVYVEDHSTPLKLDQFTSGEELRWEIESVTESTDLMQILSYSDYKSVYKTLENALDGEIPVSPLYLDGEETHKDLAQLVAYREMTDYLAHTMDNGFDIKRLNKCLMAFNYSELAIPAIIIPLMEKDVDKAFNKEKQEFPLEDVKQLLELVTDTSLLNMAQLVLKDPEHFDKLRYDVTVTGNFWDDELAIVHVKDRWANHDESFTIWRDEDTLNAEYLNDNTIGGTYINVYDLYERDYEPMNIDDYFGKEVAKELEKKIVQAYLNDEKLIFKVNHSEFVSELVSEHLMYQQLGLIDKKAQNGELSKNDLIVLAKVLDKTKISKVEDVGYLEQPIVETLKKSNVKHKDIKLLKESFITLDFNTNFFKHYYNKQYEMVRG